MKGKKQISNEIIELLDTPCPPEQGCLCASLGTPGISQKAGQQHIIQPLRRPTRRVCRIPVLFCRSQR